MSYHIHLQQFEGPLSLLLYLIRKEEMDILDINITEITKQYLDYIKWMKQFDLEVAGEFVAMAATLIHIKSRLLLPNYDEDGEEIEGEDPRKELVKKLLEFQKYQEAGQTLYTRPLLGRDIFRRGMKDSVERPEDEIVIEGDNALFSLISAWRRVQRSAGSRVHRVDIPIQSIASRIREIRSHFDVGKKVKLSELYDEYSDSAGRKLLITFLSSLELSKMGYLKLFQTEIYGEIYAEAIRPIGDDVLSNIDEYAAATIDSLDDDSAADEESIEDLLEASDSQGPGNAEVQEEIDELQVAGEVL